MAQQIDVVATRNQITKKLKAILDAQEKHRVAADKYDADVKVHHDKYKKVLADWNAKVVKALIKSATVPNMRVSVTGNYYGASSSTLHVTLDEVDLSAFGNQPQPVNNSKFEEEWKKSVN